jgi:hypothetical protein
MTTGFESTGSPQPNTTTAGPSTPGPGPSLSDVTAMAETLDPQDQVRLVARLSTSLSSMHRAAVVEYEPQLMHSSSDIRGTRVDSPTVASISSKLWERLFDPTYTSRLYSAPRRFDLATLFVVTAAYSILFGAMSALHFYFGPLTKVVVGVLVTVVAVAQAFYKDTANPRGVSVVTGTIVQTLMMTLIEIFAPQLFPEPALLVVGLYGVLGGAISGYLAGVLVGGVFLVAEALRKRYIQVPEALQGDESTDDSELVKRGKLPWAN